MPNHPQHWGGPGWEALEPLPANRAQLGELAASGSVYSMETKALPAPLSGGGKGGGPCGPCWDQDGGGLGRWNLSPLPPPRSLQRGDRTSLESPG